MLQSMGARAIHFLSQSALRMGWTIVVCPARSRCTTSVSRRGWGSALPYFTVGTALVDEADAKIPCAGYVEFNERLVPTGTILDVTESEGDYRRYRHIGSRRFNHCYVELERDEEGMATASLRHVENGRTIDIVMDRSFSAIVVYTGDAVVEPHGRALAISRDLRNGRVESPRLGLKTIASEEAFTGRYLIRSRATRPGKDSTFLLYPPYEKFDQRCVALL